MLYVTENNIIIIYNNYQSPCIYLIIKSLGEKRHMEDLNARVDLIPGFLSQS